MSSVRSCLKFPLCPTKPMSDGSRMDRLLAKTKPISNGGSASTIADLRQGRKLPCCCSCSQKSTRSVREYVRETAPQTARSVGEEGEEVVQAAEQMSLQTVVKTMERQLCRCSPEEAVPIYSP